MARQQQERLTPKQQALRDLEDARASLAHHAVHAMEEWSPQALITRSVQKHRGLWIGAATIAGAAFLKWLWPTGSSHSRQDHPVSGARYGGWLALLLSPLAALVRKSVLNYGTQWFETYLHQKVSPNDSDAGTV